MPATAATPTPTHTPASIDAMMERLDLLHRGRAWCAAAGDPYKARAYALGANRQVQRISDAIDSIRPAAAREACPAAWPSVTAAFPEATDPWAVEAEPTARDLRRERNTRRAAAKFRSATWRFARSWPRNPDEAAAQAAGMSACVDELAAGRPVPESRMWAAGLTHAEPWTPRNQRDPFAYDPKAPAGAGEGHRKEPTIYAEGEAAARIEQWANIAQHADEPFTPEQIQREFEQIAKETGTPLERVHEIARH